MTDFDPAERIERMQRMRHAQGIRKRGPDTEDPITGLSFWWVLAAPGLVALLVLAAIFSIDAAIVVLVVLVLAGAGALLVGEYL